MDKQNRLQNTIAGQSTDRIPVALWRHFPGDDQRTADFAQSTLEFQRTYNWDFMKVTPASTYCVLDYGVQAEWQGSPDGDRTVVKHVVTRSLEWTELRTLDPRRGELGKHIEALQMIQNGLQDNTPVIMTVYSPLAQAERLAGPVLLRRNMRTHADRLRSGLNIITDNTLRFIEALKRTSISGIYYVIEHASYDLMSETEYGNFGTPYDHKILSELHPAWWLNIAQVRSEAPMFNMIANYNVHAVNWQGRTGKPDITQGKSLLLGAVCGGLAAWNHLHNGSPFDVRDAIRDTIRATNGRRLILSAEGVVPVATPLSNLRAVRTAVEPAGVV